MALDKYEWEGLQVYERVLVPLDGSEVSEVSLPYAVELAGKLGAMITLLYVSKTTGDTFRHMQEFYLRRVIETVKRGVEKQFGKPAAETVRVEPAVVVGDPAEQIVDYAEKENIGLILMATHGRSGVRRWTLGSVASKVTRSTRRPVVLIRAKGAGGAGAREHGVLNKVLVSLDGSPESEAVLPHIDDLAPRLKAEVVLVQIVEQAYHVFASEGGVGQIPFTDDEMKPLVDGARTYLKKIEDKLRDKGIKVTSEVRVGAPAEEIIKFADEVKADIVVMATHGRSGIGRWIFGSVSGKVLREGNTPILLVRTPGARIE
ncbi:MAG: universal stress protein [Dehalococcoidales bacterium]|nr:universal stress protein [Dehalococcoidales bacterium]